MAQQREVGRNRAAVDDAELAEPYLFNQNRDIFLRREHAESEYNHD
jgi:hypothetical protein